LANNQIVSIETEMCYQLTSLNYLDFRNNSIKVLNKHIKAMMQLKFVFLDCNQLSSFPEELCSLRLLEELTLSQNKITNIPADISNLNCLTTLHLNDNRISMISDSLGQMKSLQILHLHGNQFTSFHCSVGALPTLNEFSLEWFTYAKPPKPKCVIKAKTPIIFSSLQSLCQLPITAKNQKCDVVFFLETLSDVVFNVNAVDSRMRTALHNAAAKGDIGVVRGLLQNRSTNPNLLDKD
jgi:Leucine-rich repeat (LRR) protein